MKWALLILEVPWVFLCAAASRWLIIALMKKDKWWCFPLWMSIFCPGLIGAIFVAMIIIPSWINSL